MAWKKTWDSSTTPVPLSPEDLQQEIVLSADCLAESRNGSRAEGLYLVHVQCQQHISLFRQRHFLSWRGDDASASTKATVAGTASSLLVIPPYSSHTSCLVHVYVACSHSVSDVWSQASVATQQCVPAVGYKCANCTYSS